MKKFFLSLFVLLAFASGVQAQAYIARQIKAGISYPNGNKGNSTATFPDSIKNSTVDSVKIDLLSTEMGGSFGGGFPVGVAIYVTVGDADVSAGPDTINVLYDTGVNGQFVAVEGMSAISELLATGTYTRTFLFTGLGATLDSIDVQNQQLSVIPWGEQIRVRLANEVTGGATDTAGYKVHALAIYRKP